MGRRSGVFFSVIGLCIASWKGPAVGWILSSPQQICSSSNPRDFLGIGSSLMQLVKETSCRDKAGPDPVCWCSYKEKKEEGQKTQRQRREQCVHKAETPTMAGSQ